MTETLHLKKNDTLKATTYEMVNTEVIPIVNHQQIILENYETFGDTIPPAHLIAMNAAQNFMKNKKPSTLKPQQLFCSTCNEIILTKVEKKVGDGAFLMGGVLCICGCFLGCCLIPCFIDECKDSNHFCPKCNYSFGVFSFLSYS